MTVDMGHDTTSGQPTGGKWWLVTWTTYASWLPGDPRGFRTWRGRAYVPPPARYASAGEPTYNAAEYREQYRIAQEISEPAVVLIPSQREIACRACIADLDEMGIAASAIAVGAQHTHLLARFGSRPIRLTVGRLKSMMTRAIRESDAAYHPKRTWSKGCHPRSCKDDRDYHAKLRYVVRHRNEVAAVHVWPNVIVTPDQFS